MELTRRRMLQLTAGAALASRWPAPAAAADFPTKPVTLICPWPPGGSTDIEMRALAEATGRHLGQPVVIDNKPGGSGTVGPATMAATARPDGHTIAQIPITIFRLPHMMKVTWDPLRDFTYIVHVTGYTFGVVVKADSPWKTWPEFVAHAKANPGKITYASPGAGTTLHITMAAVAVKEGIKWIHVPMKGSAETVPAVLGGHVNATADSTSWGPQVDAGNLRLLCTWGNQRTKRWPQVPTLKELGYGIVSSSPYGLAGPKGMDPKVVKVLHDAFKKGLEDPAHLKALERLDMEPFYKNTEDYAKYVKEQIEEARREVEQAGLAKKS
ncbi:MAG: tripartite tricarboxylate transporter substrate binding protein [Candidatus Rokubacteria bacterium]|nr:tripartite tricarboxylate transporter substrate binding protein [Candidatus Rokubacteria bacterium]